MTNHAISTSDKSLSSNQEEYNPNNQPWFELAQRWIPRLLGIVPLLVLTSSLMSQGGIQLGIEMYIASFASTIGLLFIFIIFTSIDIKLSNDSQEEIKPRLWNSLCEKIINLFSLRKIALQNDSSQPRVANSVKKSLAVTDNFDPPHTDDIRVILTKRLSDFSLSARELFLYLWFLRIQVFTAFVCALLFQTGQVNDIVLAIILDKDWRALWFAILFAFIFSLLLWHTSRYLTRSVRKRKWNKGDLKSVLFSPTLEMILLWLAWLSLALFTVPIATQVDNNSNSFLLHMYILLVIQFVIILCWRLFDRPISTLTKKFCVWFIPLYGIGLLVPLLLQHLNAYELPELIGSLGILFWAFSAILILASIVFQFSILTGVPLLSTLLVTAYFVNMNRINDNHAVRIKQRAYISAKTVSDYKLVNVKLPTLEDQFKTWVTTKYGVNQKSIIDLAKEKREECLNKINPTSQASIDCRYPIYIASAQGGGIYAAYHAAKTFQTITSNVPDFPNHFFAISSVSGGSVGSAIYVNSLRGCDSTKLGKHDNAGNVIDSFFDKPRDPLALIVASMFFGDLFQRIYPIPVAQFDRSLGLELAFEPRIKQGRSDKMNLSLTQQALDNGNCIDLRKSFYETQGVHGPFTKPNTGDPVSGPAPFLVLNTTEVENGRRYLISPFRVNSDYTDADFHEPWPNAVENVQFRDMSYSTAAGLSARFPLISPYGFFPEQNARRFIDGGLYDNSGAVTAYEIFWSLHNYLTHTNKDFTSRNIDKTNDTALSDLFKLKIISILDKNTVDLNSNYSNPEQLAKASQVKIIGWSALTAVFSTRESRTGKAVDIFSSVDNYPYKGSRNNNMDRRVLLEKDFLLAGMARPLFSIPLGWKLSCQARAFINDQLQVDSSYHVFLPCEFNNNGTVMIKREPVRYRPAHVVNNNHSTADDDISSSIKEIIKKIRADIDPIKYRLQ